MFYNWKEITILILTKSKKHEPCKRHYLHVTKILICFDNVNDKIFNTSNLFFYIDSVVLISIPKSLQLKEDKKRNNLRVYLCTLTSKLRHTELSPEKFRLFYFIKNTTVKLIGNYLSLLYMCSHQSQLKFHLTRKEM